MDIIKQYKKDVRKALKADSPSMIEKCLPLVIKIATKYSAKSNVDILDLIQEGNMGLFEAKKHYKSEKVKFSTYAYPWICKYILAFIDQELKLSSFKSKMKTLMEDEDPVLLLAEFELEEDIIRKDLIQKFKQTLNTLQKEVFKLVLEQGYTVREASEHLPINFQRVNVIKNELLKQFVQFNEEN